MLSVDARGVSCPQPILMVKKAIGKDTKALEVLVDDNTAKNNVERFLRNNGFKKIKHSQSGETITLRAEK